MTQRRSIKDLLVSKSFLLAAWSILLVVVSATVSSTWLKIELQGSITSIVLAKGSDVLPVINTILLVNLAGLITVWFAAPLARKIVSGFVMILSISALWQMIAFSVSPARALTNTLLLRKATGISDAESQLSLISAISLDWSVWFALSALAALALVQLMFILIKIPVASAKSKITRNKANTASDHPIDLWDTQG